MRRELPGKERLDVECHASAPFQHANTFVQNVLHSGEISQQRLYSIPKLYGGEVTIMSTQLSGIRHSTSQQSPQTIVFDKSQAVPRLSARMTTSGYKNRTVPFLHLQKFSNLRGKISVILHAPVQAACFEKMAATLFLASQPRAGNGPRILRHGTLRHCGQQVPMPVRCDPSTDAPRPYCGRCSR